MIDLFFPQVVISLFHMSFVIFFASLYFDFDPLYFLLEDLTTIPPHKRSTGLQTFLYFIRVVSLSGLFETGRLLCASIFSALLLLEKIQKCLTVLNSVSGQISLTRVMVLYNQLSVVYRISEKFLLEILSFGISMGFCVLICVLYLCIKCRLIMPGPLYAVFVFVAAVCVPCMFVVLSCIANVCEMCLIFLRRVNIRTKFYWCDGKSVSQRKEGLTLKAAARGLRKLHIAYKPFLNIDNTFVFITFNFWMLRLIDVVITF